MQAKYRNASQFSERTDALAKRLGVPLRELGGRIGLSTSIIFAYRNGSQEISDKAWSKLERAERGDPATYEDALEEPRPPFSQRTRPSVQLNPAYATPPPPVTREQIEAKIAAFLDAAAQVPGGLGHAWALACIHFNPTSLEALKSSDE